MAIKINSLEFENIKRIKAVGLEPTKNGLTIIGGNNNQGKTSVLDAIAWTLGGNKYKPSNPKNDDSVVDPYLKVTLSNGLVVERKGKNSDLKVTDPTGQKAGQNLLDSFISQFALDLPKFMNQTSLEKGRSLLKLVGLEEDFLKLKEEERRTYAARYEIGRIRDQKEKYADELIEHVDVPEEKISAFELIQKHQAILAKNGENQKLRDNLITLIRSQESDQEVYKNLEEKIKELEAKKKEVLERLTKRADNILTAKKTVEELKDESTEEIVNSINNIEIINKKIDENLSKKRAILEADEYREQYDSLTEKITKLRADKISLLKNANLPLPGLSIEEGELTYMGQKWDNMSSSQQLVVATSIVKSLNPDCGFVLLDKLEQMDLDTLSEFGKWLEKEGLQVIATRVSKGDECSVIIEDGMIKENKWDEVIF